MVLAGSGQSAPSHSGKAGRTGRKQPPHQQARGADRDLISLRLSEAEAENQELRKRLAEANAKLQEADELRRRLAEAEELAVGRAALDARLREAEAENEALRRRLADDSPDAKAPSPPAPPPPAPPPPAPEPSAQVKMGRVRIGVGQQAKTKGNEELKDGDLDSAIALYRRGIQSVQPLLDSTAAAAVGAEEQALLEEAAELEVSLQLNLALAAIKKESWWVALDAAGAVLDRRPGNAKALYRRGVALARLGQTDSATEDFEELLRQGPNADAERELRALRPEGSKEGPEVEAAGGDAAEEEEEEEEEHGDGDAETTEAPEAMAQALLKARDVLGTGTLAMNTGQLDVASELFSGGLEVLQSLRSAPCMSMPEVAAQVEDVEVKLFTSVATVCLRKQDFEGALEAAEQALQRRPGDAKATLAREAAVEHVGEVRQEGAYSPPRRDRMRTPSGGINAVEVIRTCLAAAQGAKHLGNEAMHSGDLERAAEHYAKSLKMIEVLPLRETARELGIDLEDLDMSQATPDIQVLKEATDLELSLQLNIALVCIKREDYEGAAEAASAVLDRRPSDSKALYRRGLARLHLNLRRGACSDFRALLKAEPGMAHTVRRHLAEAYDLAKDDLHPDWADLFQRSRGRAPEGGASPGTQDSDEEDDAEDDAEDDDDDDEDVADIEGDSDDDNSGTEDIARGTAEGIAADATASASDDVEKQRAAEQLLRVHEQAQAMKICGNEHYRKGELQAALWCYSQGAVQAAQASRLSARPVLKDFEGVTGEAEQLEVALRLNLALCHLKLEEFEDAETAASAALKLQMDNTKGLFRRAQANIGRARLAEERRRVDEARMLCEAAVVDLRRVVVAEPKNNEARRMLSALKGREAPAQAEEAKEASENPFAGMFGDQKVLKERHRAAKERRLAEEISRLREAGNSAHRVGDYCAAEEHYSAALLLDTTSAPLLLNRAAARLMLDEHRSALEDCEKAIELQPGVAKGYARAAKCRQLLGDLDGAGEVLSKGLAAVGTLGDRDDLEAQRRGLAMVARKLADVEHCLHADLEGPTEGRHALRLLDELDKQKQVAASRLRPLRLRAILQSRDSSGGLGQEAPRLANEVLQQPPPGTTRPELLFWKASAYLLAGDRATAKVTLREVASLTAAAEEDADAPGPIGVAAAALLSRLTEADSAKDRGNVYFKDRRWEEAVECYEDALRASIRDAEFCAVLHTNIAAALRKVEQREADALKHAIKATEANPRYAKAYFRRGVLHYDAGRWRQSLDDFQRARELEPKLQGLDQWLKRGRHAAREGTDRKNHYKALNLQCECEPEEIKKRFRQLARECHPDKVRDAPDQERVAAEARFKAVNEAHEVLSNEKARREYDFGTPEQDFDPFGGGFHGMHRPRRGPFGGRAHRNPWRGHGGYGGYDEDDDDEDMFHWFS